ncbi:MAG: hypothetical protein ACT4PL_01680 [Phycisphaerales bacterium]
MRPSLPAPAPTTDDRALAAHAPHAEPARAIGLPELAAALRSGKAGFLVRLILTLGVVAFTVALSTGALGLIDAGTGVRDWHVAVVVPSFCIVGLAACSLVWATYGRWRRVLKTIFICLCIVALTIGAGIVVALLGRRMEAVVVAVAFAGAAGLTVVIGAAVHLGMRGRPVRTAEGAVRVECPGCGYSLAGLDNTSCPECGHRCTIDELIRAQDYDGARAGPSPAALPHHQTPQLAAAPGQTIAGAPPITGTPPPLPI